jgi:agmatine deiminase
MPAEWERHDATWLGWPHNPSDWPDKLDTIRWVYGEMVRRISAAERVRLLVDNASTERLARRYLARAGCDLRKVDFIKHPTNRGWMRDSGPIFVRKNPTPARPGRATTAIVHFHFNAWAKYDDWQLDSKVPAYLGKRPKLPLRIPDMVLEGGSIDVNGAGMLLTTEECLLSPVQQRNPGFTREEIEKRLRDFLGVQEILWLKNGIAGDDTHGHVDDLARFTDARTVVVASEDDRSDANYEALKANYGLLKSTGLKIVKLPMPKPLIFDGRRLPASYANFYIANSLVLVPTFNDPNDRVALSTLARLFPRREVVGINCTELIWGLGALHCMTQQQPA